MEKRERGRPRGSKNKPKDVSMVASSSAVPMQQRPGRPLGSKNKPRPSSSVARQVVDANTAPRNASPPPPVNLFSFFLLSLVLNAVSSSVFRSSSLNLWTGASSVKPSCAKSLEPPYEVEVYYDGRGEMYFRGGWPQFAEDHELHQGFFMVFNYHCGTSKFDVKIFDCTQCQKKYEAEVHFQ
jgi:hypothetical protein